jgi:hypothetical protein
MSLKSYRLRAQPATNFVTFRRIPPARVEMFNLCQTVGTLRDFATQEERSLRGSKSRIAIQDVGPINIKAAEL